jgi:hypothetical protein
LNDIRSDKGQQAVLASMADAVQKTNDPTLFEKYAQRTAARLGVSGLAAITRFKAALSKRASRSEPEAADERSAAPTEPRPNTQEFWLLKILLQHDEKLDWARKHLHLDWIQHSGARQILGRRLAFDDSGHPIQPATLLGEFESDSLRSLITEALAEERNIPNLDQQLADLTTRLRNQSIDREIATLSQSLGQPNLTPEETAQILHELTALRAAKRTPLSAAA